MPNGLIQDPILDAKPSMISQAQREAGIVRLRGYIRTLQRGDTTELGRLGFPIPFAHSNPTEFDRLRRGQLDQVSWQFLRFCRFNTPYPAWDEECVPEAMEACYHWHTTEPFPGGIPYVDNILLCYRAIILSREGGRDQEAAKLFKKAFEEGRQGTVAENELMFRAYYARVLRRLTRVAEAQKHEQAVAAWIKGHKYGLPPSTIYSAILLPHESREENEIMKLIPGHFDNLTEIGGGITVEMG